MNPFSGMHDPHRDCWDLIPWIANERIAAQDFKRIEAHLSACGRCQDELALQRKVRELMRTDDAIVIAPQASLQKLMQRIDGVDPDERTETVSSVPEPPAGRSNQGRRASRWLAIAAGIQALAIGLLLAALCWQSQAIMTAPRYSTLTTAASAPEGPVIRIVFRNDVTIGEVNEIVRSLDAHIIAGPNSAGVYTLQLAREQRTNAAVERLAARLRDDERVLFSEPAVAEVTAR